MRYILHKDVFGKSHTRSLKFTNENARTLWAWPRVQSNTSMKMRADHNVQLMSIHEESSIRLTKNASILHSSKKNQVFSPCSRHVTVLANTIARSTLFSLIIYSWQQHYY